MPLVICLCGDRIEAGDREALVEAFWSHTNARHADIPIPDSKRRDIDDAIRQSGGWDGAKEPLGDTIEIRPVTPAMREQYLTYFDGPAFCDNPVWAQCYCLSYHLDLPPEEQFDLRAASVNRAARSAQIARGEASGVLAFSGGTIVGWCNASPRRTLPLLDKTRGFECDDPDATGAIVCYVIAPQYRGQGIARRLLEGAERHLRERGFRWIEAFPPKEARTDAGSYHGKLSMYRDAGFEQIREAERYVVVRKRL